MPGLTHCSRTRPQISTDRACETFDLVPAVGPLGITASLSELYGARGSYTPEEPDAACRKGVLFCIIRSL